MLFPAIFIHWQDYQRKILNRLKDLESLVISGDARHDSMGHSAKYGAYTIFCCTSQEIIHFDLIQVIDSIDYYAKYTSMKHNPKINILKPKI